MRSLLPLNAMVGMVALSEVSQGFLSFHQRAGRSPSIGTALSAAKKDRGEPHARISGIPDDSPISHSVRVSYETCSVDMVVSEDETILAALERQGINDRLGLPSNVVPSDCRRGNCLTCTATHASATSQSNSSNIVTDDGLSPHMSNWMKEKGYVLTCSSKVVGDGLELRLGANSDAWEEAYFTRLEGDHAKRVGWAAVARTKRKSDEKNVPRWTKETEGALQKGQSPNDEM